MGTKEIRTTVDIDLKWLTVIEDYAQRKNISISEVMNIVLEKHIQKLANNPKRKSHAMKYQQRGTQYASRHIRLSQITYSQLRDVMILFRYTLSYLLSLAMEFFDTYMGEDGSTDCCPPRMHCCIITLVDSMSLFANYWGIPPGDHEIKIPG